MVHNVPKRLPHLWLSALINWFSILPNYKPVLLSAYLAPSLTLNPNPTLIQIWFFINCGPKILKQLFFIHQLINIIPSFKIKLFQETISDKV